MRIDVEKSKYHPREDVEKDFDREEIKHLKIVLRRLRYLEQKLREGGDLLDGNGSAVFDDLEVQGLAFTLTEIGYLGPVREVAG